MTNFLYLPDWQVSKVQRSTREYIVTATYDKHSTVCPKCGVVGELYRHGTKAAEFRDAPVHGKQVTIQVDRQRYRCRACERTFLQELPDMDEQRRMTVRCLDYIGEQSLLRPFTHVAYDIGVNEKTIRNIAAERIDSLSAAHELRAPRILGIDEVTVMRRPRAVFTVIRARILFGRRTEDEELQQCASCKAVFRSEEHVVPSTKGGRSAPLLLCSACNQIHTDQWFTRHATSTLKSE